MRQILAEVREIGHGTLEVQLQCQNTGHMETQVICFQPGHGISHTILFNLPADEPRMPIDIINGHGLNEEPPSKVDTQMEEAWKRVLSFKLK